MPKIFISYRRDDSSAITGRIRESLVKRFGGKNVFRDLNSIPIGADFRDVIEEGVASCDVLLVIIGDKWASITDSSGRKRLDNPDDFVRIEVETALRIHKIRVVPVLVNGLTRMPTEGELPSTLRKLPYLNAAVVRDGRDFDTDVAQLMDALVGQKSRVPYAVAAVIALIVLGIIALLISNSSQNTPVISPTTAVAADVATNTAQPSDVPTTEAAPVNTTATLLILQRTADAQEATNAALLTENTAIAATATAHAMPTDTAVPTVTPSETSLPSSNTPVPQMTPVPPTHTPMPTFQPTSFAAGDTFQLELSADSDTLTLYVSQKVSLAGLEFVVVNNGTQEVHPLEQAFNILQLTQHIAEANSCFVYRLSGSSSPLPDKCDGNRTFRQEFARSDIFWYDSVANRLRDVVISDNGNFAALCAASNPSCAINWPIVSPATNTLASTPISSSQGYPCPATVKNNDTSQVTVLKIVRSQPMYAAEPTSSVRFGQSVFILQKEMEGSRTIWYLIADDQQHELGYVLEDFLDLSASCPA